LINYRNLNIYEATIPDQMHYLDLGLFHYQIEYTRAILNNSNNDEINRRLAKIPRFPGIKIFSHGIQTIARFIADEYRNLMKVMIFVIDNLYSDDIKINIHSIKNKELAILYQEWNEMYTFSRLDEYSESDLKDFKVRKNILNNNFIFKLLRST
jgi:hypothetical protein